MTRARAAWRSSSTCRPATCSPWPRSTAPPTPRPRRPRPRATKNRPVDRRVRAGLDQQGDHDGRRDPGRRSSRRTRVSTVADPSPSATSDFDDVEEHATDDDGRRHPRASRRTSGRSRSPDSSARTASPTTSARSASASARASTCPGEAPGSRSTLDELQRHQHGRGADRLRHRGHRHADARRVHDDRQPRHVPARRGWWPRRSTPTAARHDEPLAAPQQVVSAATAEAVNGMLQKVVNERHRHARPQIPGYQVAGKTGTARKAPYDTGEYDRVVRRVRAGRATAAGGDRGDGRARRAASTAPTPPPRCSSRSCGSRSPTSGCRRIVSPGPPRGPPTGARYPDADPVTDPRGRPRVRWHDLLAGLDAPTLRPVGGADPDVEVVGDHPRQPPGDPRARASRASPARSTDGHDHAPDAVAGGAVALLVSDRLPLDGRPGARSPSVRAALGPVAAALFGRPVDARCGCSASPAPTARPPPPTSSRRSRVRAGERAGVMGTVGRARRGRDDRRPAHTTPEADRAAGAARAHARRGVDDRRDGGVVARARPAPRRRHAVRRGVLHQPQSRPPRLPRHARRVLRGQGVACSRRAFTDRAAVNVDDPRGRELAAHARGDGARRAGRSRSTTPTPTSRADDVVARADGTRVDARRPAARRATRSSTSRCVGAFNVANALGRRRPPPGRPASTFDAIAPGSPTRSSCPAGWSGSTPASRSRSWSTTPTRPTRSSRLLARGPPADRRRRPGARACSGAAATGIRASGR